MNHEAHVRLVDSHTEGNRCNNDVHLLHEESVLVFGPGLRVEPCMIWPGLYPVDIQQFCHFLNLLSTEAVDDSGLSRILTYELDYVSLGILLVPDFIVEVRPIE